MLISYNWLQEYFDKKLPTAEKLADALTFHAFEIESLEKKGSDTLIDIKVLPNRAHDALCHSGIAREVSAILMIPVKKKIKVRLPKPNAKVAKIDVKVVSKQVVPRFTAIVIEGVKVTDSPKWLRARLESIGQRSINNIVDATNFVMFELGQPLHAYDLDKLEHRTIIARYAKDGERLTTLDKKDVLLTSRDLVISGKNTAYGIAGVKGGVIPEVDSTTSSVVIEAANFDPETVRRTSQTLNIRTDASKRFESGITSEYALSALERVTEVILEVAGTKDAKIGQTYDLYPKKEKQRKLSITTDEVNRIIGTSLTDKDIAQTWKRLGFIFSATRVGTTTRFTITVPFDRLDITLKEDLAEEVGRLTGLADLVGTLPKELMQPVEVNRYWVVKDVIREIMLGYGFSEVYTYAFMGEGEIEVANPISSDKRFLRNNLMTGLKQAVSENLKYLPEAKIFEFGHIFGRNAHKISETQSFAVLTGYRKRKEAQQKDDFFFLKGTLEQIFAQLHIEHVEFREAGGELVASIQHRERVLGYMTQSGYELDLDLLVELSVAKESYVAPSKYPAIERDISLFVPIATRVKDVEEVIRKHAGNLVKRLFLFDIFETAEQKSFAFRMVLQSDERTLSDAEANTLYDEVVTALEGANNGWVVRK